MGGSAVPRGPATAYGRQGYRTCEDSRLRPQVKGDPLSNLLNLLTIIRILLIQAINILLLQELMASIMPHLQMHIVCRHHFLDLAIHTHLHTTTPLPKHLHHVSVRLLPANTAARERSARNISELISA